MLYEFHLSKLFFKDIGQEGGLTTKRPGDVVEVAGTVLYLERGGGYTAFYLCQNLHNCTLKRVGGTVCKL